MEVLDNADQLSSPQNDFDRITFWKKQLLGKNLDVPEVTEQAPEKPGEGDATVTIIKEDVSAVQEIVNSNCTDDENAVSCQDREEEIVSVADCDVSVCSSEHAVPDNEVKSLLNNKHMHVDITLPLVNTHYLIINTLINKFRRSRTRHPATKRAIDLRRFLTKVQQRNLSLKPYRMTQATECMRALSWT